MSSFSSGSYGRGSFGSHSHSGHRRRRHGQGYGHGYRRHAPRRRLGCLPIGAAFVGLLVAAGTGVGHLVSQLVG